MRLRYACTRPALAAALLLASISCLDDDGPTGPGEPLLFSNVLKQGHSGIVAARTEVIREESRWAAVWSEIHGSGAPPRPTVDFTREMLVLVGIGERNDGCWDVEILELSSAGGRIRVRAEERHRAPCICTQALTQPVQIVRSVRADGGANPEIVPRTVGCQ